MSFSSDKLGIIIMKGSEEFGLEAAKYIAKLNNKNLEDIIIKVDCPRFSSGEAKALISSSVRGMDLFVIVDVFNYSISYKMYGIDNMMGPDDHFQDLKRVISTATGVATRITVIMPMLYEGRQHRCTSRESLDCAVFLRELEMYGVTNIVTFDAHDERVKNAIPFIGFDNISPSRNMISAFVKEIKELNIKKEDLIIISPDEGSIPRCIHYATTLGLELGVFYKRRDYSRIENGKNPIIAHEFLGSDLKGKSVIIVDDIISSGGSILDIATKLKDRGANKIFAIATFGLFTEGIEEIKDAYKKGNIERIFVTNLTYINEEYKKEKWLCRVDMSKVVGDVVNIIHTNESMGKMLLENLDLKDLL